MSRVLLLNRDRSSRAVDGPQQGVIDDARQRQRLRHKRSGTTLLLAGLIAGVAWAFSGADTHNHRERAGTGAVSPRSTDRTAFNVRLVPMFSFVGVAGWCEVPEEHGVSGGSACGGLPTPSQPFLQILGWGEANSHTETQVAVTDPDITAILVDGRQPVQTTTLRGLPYGLRAVRVVTRVGARLTALDTHGRELPQQWMKAPRQATVRRWHYPERPPRAACQLTVSGLPSLRVRGGAVATTIRRFAGLLIGHAFLPCAISEYTLGGEPVKAIVALDAAQPGSRAADLPSFHAIREQPGMFAGGSLTAMRSGNTWLVAEQGRGAHQRILLLRHLRALVHLGS